jgi:hypothetical protein
MSATLRDAAPFVLLSVALYALGFAQSDWWALAGGTTAAAAAVWRATAPRA